MSSTERQIYRFADVEVNTSQNCLKCGGEERHLRRKAFYVLVYLLEHRQQIVTKDELTANIWKNTAVTDDALVQCIKEIRRAIGDNSQNPLFIKTFPKSGYRFIGSIEETDDRLPPIEVDSEEVDTNQEVDTNIVRFVESPPSFVRSAGRMQSRVISICILVSVPLILSFGLLSKNLLPVKPDAAVIDSAKTPDKKSLAVLYFNNQSNNSEFEWLREGIPDMLITNFSHSEKINVLSRQNFYSNLGQNNIADSDLTFEQSIEIARRNQATNFITGSFAVVGEKIRLDAQLYDAETGSLLAAESLTADKVEELFSEIDLLSVKLNRHWESEGRETPARITEFMTDNLEAYRYYSLGIEKAEALHNTEAIELLEKAVALDRQFAMAYARIGYVYSITWGLSDKGKPYLEKAFKLSNKLTEKDRLNINAWYAIANFDYPAAIQVYREIIDKFPLETESYWRLGRLLAGEEQSDEAIRVLKQGLSVDSENKNIYNSLGNIYSVLGRHEEAIAAHRRYVALAPTESNAYDSLGLSYQWAGDYDSAIVYYNQALKLNPNFEVALVHLANTRLALGQYQESENLFEHYIKTAPSVQEKERGWDGLIEIYLRKGELGTAEKAADEKFKIEKSAVWRKYQVATERGDSIRAAKLKELIFLKPPVTERGARLKQRFDLFAHGYLAMRENQFDQALAYFKETVKSPPPTWSYESFEDCLANAYLKLGRFDEAIAEYQRILQLNPNYPLARFHLAQAYERQNHLSEARANYERFLEIWSRADQDLTEIRAAKQFLGKS